MAAELRAAKPDLWRAWYVSMAVLFASHVLMILQAPRMVLFVFGAVAGVYGEPRRPVSK